MRKTCLNCDGFGYWCDDGGRDLMPADVPCPDCGASGYIYIKELAKKNDTADRRYDLHDEILKGDGE